MEADKALEILTCLADGMDPSSGRKLPAESPYQNIETVRALSAAIAALRKSLNARSSRPGQGNSGKPWTKDEDAALATNFDNGMNIADLATAHGRSGFAIEARLVKLGKLPPDRMPTFPNRQPKAAAQGR